LGSLFPTEWKNEIHVPNHQVISSYLSIHPSIYPSIHPSIYLSPSNLHEILLTSRAAASRPAFASRDASPGAGPNPGGFEDSMGIGSENVVISSGFSAPF